MPVSEIVLWISLANSTLALAGVAWSFLTSGSRTNAKALEEHGRRLQLLEREIELAKARLDAAPTQKAMQEISNALTKLDGEIGMLTERIKPVAANADRMLDWLTKHGGA